MGLVFPLLTPFQNVLNLTFFKMAKFTIKSYERGKPLGSLTSYWRNKKTRNLIRFWPDPEIFQETTDI